MSASVTQCPECSTRFRVTTEQLLAHDGMVRCGRCSAVFKATEHLHDDEPNPQLSLLIAIAEETQVADEYSTEISDQVEVAIPAAGAASEEIETLADQILFHEESAVDKISEPPKKQRLWPWVTATLFLLLTLLAQGIYFFRVDIAAQLPGFKPALLSYCSLLKCTIPLPKKSELMSIESSDLEADPVQANVITLSAILRNRATHVQTYPSLELSLTDVQDKLVARRIFTPVEYLHSNDIEANGIGANRELNIQLHLDSSELRPTGYKLLLFFPTNHN